ncbi:maltose ABC transporter substrate-binding protein [Paenibacillus sp. HB172176]|uniref:sugar ABC transporter substrate-binding protein n=1 Tax=Paenibacillus sp. HB172176 TaxID=2493690 RepID=UPI00143CA0FF|nr:maltose ABC transporter substrate-binding protein [Paenibacillus sp. HB172176]
MKKVLSTTAISIMAIALAACSSGNGGNNNVTSPPSASPENVEATSTNEITEGLQPEEGASLIIWEDKNQRTFIETMAKEFEQQYGVAVKMEELAPPDQVTKLTTDGPAGLGADVVVFPHDQIGRAAQAGLIFPNEEFKDETVSENAENAVKAVTFDNVLYGYPYAVETYALYYNKKLIPEPPKTMDEVISFAETFNDVKNNKFALMWELQQFYYDYAFLVTPGGYMFGQENTDKNDIGLNNEGSIEGGKFMQTLKEKVLPLNTGDVNYDIKKGLFTGGTLAMDINGPWALSDYRATDGLDFGVAPLPTINGKPMVSFSGVKAYYVNANSNYPNAAKLFARFLSTKEAQLKNFETNGLLPSNVEAAADPVISNDEVTKAFLEQFNNSTPMPSIPEMGNVWGPITAGIAAIWDDGKDVKESLDNAVKQIKEAITSS